MQLPAIVSVRKEANLVWSLLKGLNVLEESINLGNY